MGQAACFGGGDGADRRRVFDAADSRGSLVGLDDVGQALAVARHLPSDADRAEYCAAMGVDYGRAVEYYEAVAALERSLQASGGPCAAAGGAGAGAGAGVVLLAGLVRGFVAQVLFAVELVMPRL